MQLKKITASYFIQLLILSFDEDSTKDFTAASVSWLRDKLQSRAEGQHRFIHMDLAVWSNKALGKNVSVCV